MSDFEKSKGRVNLRLSEDLYTKVFNLSQGYDQTIPDVIRFLIAQAPLDNSATIDMSQPHLDVPPMGDLQAELFELRAGMNRILSWIDLLVQLNAGIGKLLVDDPDQFVRWLKTLKARLIDGKPQENES